ncbi:hypothetical protein C0Z01_13260 [Photobacterium kishitanii]|nr:hypothetical protein AYY22_15135 [Photobacterium kishitanii]PSU89853.1 hypothetical protein C0W42_08650 [Photobacterium kishitanii]PSW68844.1 hypothetical protein C0Z01_13260 [Photobacterium kishitanii]
MGSLFRTKKGKLVFDKWSKCSLIFDEGILNRSQEDFKYVHENIAKDKEVKSKNTAKNSF